MGRVARMQESTEKKMTQEVAQRMGGVEKKIDDQTKEIGKRFAQMNENVQKAVDELCRRQQNLNERLKKLEKAQTTPSPNPQGHEGGGAVKKCGKQLQTIKGTFCEKWGQTWWA